MIPKDEAYRNRQLLDLSRGAPCANCGLYTDTVVPAHANSSIYGKGAMRKADDCFVADLCVTCHHWLDQGNWTDPSGRFSPSREDKLEMFRRAMDATTLRRWRLGLYQVTP